MATAEEFNDKDIRALIEAGDWHLTEEVLKEFRDWPDNNYGYIGCVCYGNNVIDIVQESFENDLPKNFIDLNKVQPDFEYGCKDEFSIQDYDLEINGKTPTGQFGELLDASRFYDNDFSKASLENFKYAVVKTLVDDKLLSKKNLKDYKKVKVSGKGFFMQVIKELDKVSEIKNLVAAGDWQLNKNAIEGFKEDKYGYYNIGNVSFGNDKVILNICESNGNLKLEYTHQGPLKEFESEAGKEQTFDIKVKPDELDPAFFKGIYGHASKEFSLDVADKDIEDLKYAISSGLLEDGVINVKDTDNYKAIRDNGTSYFKQVNEAIGNYCKGLINKPKLDIEDVMALARYYDNKVFDNLENNKEGRVNSVKRMLEDGLKPAQIGMVGSRMESVFTGNQNWARDELKSPSIQKFCEELSVKKTKTNQKAK